MIKVGFHETVDDSLLKFAVIVAQYDGKWVFCKHRDRNTYECPGGHREIGEKILDAAKRELWEETGAESFVLTPICVYSVKANDGLIVNEKETFGMLYYATITSFGTLPPLKIEIIEFFDDLPEEWTYPLIQPILLEKVNKYIVSKQFSDFEVSLHINPVANLAQHDINEIDQYKRY